MHVSYQLTPDDFYQGMMAWRNRHKWQQWVRWISYLLVAGASLTSVLILLLDRSGETTTTAVFTVIFGVLWLSYMLLAPRLPLGGNRKSPHGTSAYHSRRFGTRT